MPTSYETTSLTLLARAQAMQPEAWERVVELYAPLVRHWCRRQNLSTEDTADVFQEVFRSVADNIRRFRRDRPGDTFRGWLRMITANKIRDHFRSLKDRVEAEGGTAAQIRLAETPDPVLEEHALEEHGIAEHVLDENFSIAADEATEVSVIQQSVAKALQWIRNDFEARTWQAFWKAQVEEQPTNEIADALGMTPAAVRKAKYRVLRRLREEMQGLLD